MFGKKKSNQLKFAYISHMHGSRRVVGDTEQAKWRFMTTNWDQLIQTHIDQDHIKGLRVPPLNIKKSSIYDIYLDFGTYVHHHGVRRCPPDVPSAAETIISYVCTPDRLEAVLGDLERNFARRAAKHGEHAARRWYWWQTARTVVVFGFQIVVSAVALRELLRKLGL